MAYEKKKYINGTTPAGRFKYPKLSKPDFGTKEYPKEDGEYSVQLILNASDPATKAFIAFLDPYYQTAIKNANDEFNKLKVDIRKKHGGVKVNPLFTELYDSETEAPTGEISFKFTAKHSYVDKKTEARMILNKPPMFSATKTPLKNVDPWGGTLGKVAFSFEDGGYFIPGTAAAGLKLKLTGTQILELVEAGARDANSLGFRDEEGYDDINVPADAPASDAQDDEDGTAF